MASTVTRFRYRIAIVAALIAAGLAGAPARAATVNVTPATFAGAYSAAAAGDTLVLGPGSYGTFRGSLKTGTVTLKAATGATATMAVNFNPAANLTLDGLTLTGIDMDDSRTKNITVRNSEITGQTVFRTARIANANILFDGNHHGAWNKCSSCGEGRVWFPERTSQPSGITIQNSKFGPGGNSDGIQNGSNGTKILNNEFVGIQQSDGAAGVHADAIQLYGSQNTVIRGNYFHDVADCVMAPDEADLEVIEDNVCDANGSPYAITLLSDNGSVLRHNTIAGANRVCDYGLPCGRIYLGNKSGDPSSKGTVLQDNILTDICVCSGSASGLSSESYNLFARSKMSGAGDLLGAPSYVGGSSPSSMAGFALGSLSAGKGNASDGSDRGARVSAGGPAPDPTPAPTPSPTATASPTPTATATPTSTPTSTPTASPTPEPTPSATPTPTPEPYEPACAPTCDKQIADLKQRNADLEDALDALRQKIARAIEALQ